MTSIKYASAAGKKYETDLMKHLREKGLDVERLRLTGEEDEGDLLLRFDTGERLVVEAKRRKTMDLGGWIKEAEVEAQNYAKHRQLTSFHRPFDTPGFVVVHYRRQHNIGQSYVTTTLEEYLRQIGAV